MRVRCEGVVACVHTVTPMEPDTLERLRRQLDDAEANLLASVLVDLAEPVHNMRHE